MKQTQKNVIEPLKETYVNKILNRFANNEINSYYSIKTASHRVRKILVTRTPNIKHKMFDNFIKFYLKCHENKNMFLNMNNILPFCIDVKKNTIIFPEPVLIYSPWECEFHNCSYMYNKFFFEYIGIPTKTLSKQEANPFEYKSSCGNLFANVLYNNKIFITTFIKSKLLMSGSWDTNIIIKQFDPNVVFNDKVFKYMENLHKIKQIENI